MEAQTPPEPSRGGRQLEQLHSALAELAAQDVPEVIVRARQQARERATELLTEAMTDALLERASGELAGPPQPGPSARPAQPRQPMGPTQPRSPARPAERTAAETNLAPQPAFRSTDGQLRQDQPGDDGELGLYVYCVVPGGTTDPPPALTGIDARHPTTLLEHGGLAALVSFVPLAEFGEEQLREHLADMQWLERTALTHEHVLEAFGETTTLIPMRLCTIYRSESGVREMLTRERDPLQEALAHLEGKSEWGVKVFASVTAPEEAESTEAPEDGTDYMRRRQQQRDVREHEFEELHEMCVHIHERLAEMAADAQTSTPQRREVSGHDGEMLLSGVYLVEDGQLATFLELVQALREEHASDGLELEPTGPWPAYNFVPGTIGAAW